VNLSEKKGWAAMVSKWKVRTAVYDGCVSFEPRQF
jgi:hypothetical protein